MGDVVLIKKNFKVLRTDWGFGKILEVVKGRDEKVRGATDTVTDTVKKCYQYNLSSTIAKNYIVGSSS